MEITKVAVYYDSREEYDLAVLNIVSTNFNTPTLDLDCNREYIYFSWRYAFKYSSRLGKYSGIYEYFPISNTYIRLGNSMIDDDITLLSSFIALDKNFLVLLGPDYKSLDVYNLEGIRKETDSIFSYLVSVTFDELVESNEEWYSKYFFPLVRKYPHLIFDD